MRAPISMAAMCQCCDVGGPRRRAWVTAGSLRAARRGLAVLVVLVVWLGVAMSGAGSAVVVPGWAAVGAGAASETAWGRAPPCRS